MTVQDFIVIYNETFKFIEKKYGKYMVYNLWSTISRQWCQHLEQLVKEKGIKGSYEYWGGGTGTLDREDADCEINLDENKLVIKMNKCPSVGELKNKNREIYHDYCEHCAALYDPVLRRYGLTMKVDYDREDDSNLPAGRCISKITEL